MIHDQRYQGQDQYRDRQDRQLDVQDYPNRDSAWNRYDYIVSRQQQKTDSYRYNNVDKSREYGNWRVSRGHSRGRYRGEDKGRQGGYWNKRGSHPHRKMQGKRPCDVTFDRQEKKRRLNQTEHTYKDNFDSRSHGGRRSPSRESSRSSDSHRSRESSKDRKVLLSGNTDRFHSSKSCKRSADSTSEHSTVNRLHSKSERISAERERSKSKEKSTTSVLNSTSEVSKHRVEDEKKKETVGTENAAYPVSSTTTSGSVLKSVSLDKVSTSNTKSASNGPKPKYEKPIHLKPKPSVKTAARDTSVKAAPPSSTSSNIESKKTLPKIPKIPQTKTAGVTAVNNTGNSKISSSVHASKESSKKHHRHSVGGAPLQPSKKPQSSGTSLEKKHQIKKKHRHSSGNVTQTSPKNNMVVSSKTVSEVTSFEEDGDSSLSFLSERDETLPHLVHTKRHKRTSGSKSPLRKTVVEKTVAEKTVEADTLFHVSEEDRLCGNGKKPSQTMEKEENTQVSKTTSGKENVDQSSLKTDTNISKPSIKTHEKHKLKIKSHNKKKTQSESKDKVIASGKPADIEKVHNAAKQESSVKKLHTKSGDISEGKKQISTGSHKREGTGKESSSRKPLDQLFDSVPVMSVKKLPSEEKSDKSRTSENHPTEKEDVGSSVPSAGNSNITDKEPKESVLKSDRVSLFDLFKDSSEEQTQQKHKASVKTPDSKHSKRSPTKSSKDKDKHDHSKRKNEDKTNKSKSKKAKICESEGVSSSEKGNMSLNEGAMNASKSSAVSSSPSSHSTPDKVSSDMLEKDSSSLHNESDLSANSSGRHLDESSSVGTSFSLSSCMTSPSFNKSDTMLSDDNSEVETPSESSKPISEKSALIHSLIEKQTECDSSKGLSLCDRRESVGVLGNTSESEDDGDRLVIDLQPSVPSGEASSVDTPTEKKEEECFKLPTSKHEKSSQKRKQTQSDKDLHANDNKLSPDEVMDDHMDDFVDNEDIRLMTYNEGNIECPWTPMPATPYISSSQEEDMQDDESLPEENGGLSMDEGEETTSNHEEVETPVEEKQQISNQDDDCESQQEMETISNKETDLHKEMETNSGQEREAGLDEEKEINSDQEARLNPDPVKESCNQNQERDIDPRNEKEMNENQEREIREKSRSQEKEINQYQERVCSPQEEPLDQKIDILAAVRDVKPLSKVSEHAASAKVAPSPGKVSSDLPVTIKQEPVSSVEEYGVISHLQHSRHIHEPGLTRSSSAGHLTSQSQESSKPLIMRSQSVGGESTQSALDSCPKPNVSLDTLPQCGLEVATTEPTGTNAAPSPRSDSPIRDPYSASAINIIVKSGKLTTEQHEFMAELAKSLELLKVLGCSSIEIPLKHEKTFKDDTTYTSHGHFSPKHITDKNVMQCIVCQECSKILSPREFIEHLCGSVKTKEYDMVKLYSTTFEFCTEPSKKSDTCARVLLIIIFKLERSLYRAIKDAPVSQTVPAYDTPLAAGRRSTPTTAVFSPGVETTQSQVTQVSHQSAPCVTSTLDTSLTTSFPPVQSTSSALPTLQGNFPQTTEMIEDSISKSLAVGEYLTNIQKKVEATQLQPQIGVDIGMSAWSQGSGRRPSTECTTNVTGQSLQQNKISSIASLPGIGQQPTQDMSGFSLTQMKQLERCLRQPSTIETQKKTASDIYTSKEIPQPGSTLMPNLSRTVMENQRMQYGLHKNQDCVSQVPIPDSRMNKSLASSMYHGSGGASNTAMQGSFSPIWPVNNSIPTTCSTWNQGQPATNVQSRITGNASSEIPQATNNLRSFDVGHMSNHSSGQYQPNKITRPGANKSYKIVEPQGFTGKVGYIGCLMDTGINNDSASQSSNFVSNSTVGPFNGMSAHAPVTFPNSNMDPQRNTVPAPHGMFGPNNTTAPQSTFGPNSNTAPQSTFGPNSTTAPQSTFGLNSTTAPQSTFGPNSTTAPQSMFGSKNTTTPHGTMGPSSNTMSHGTFGPTSNMPPPYRNAVESQSHSAPQNSQNMMGVLESSNDGSIPRSTLQQNSRRHSTGQSNTPNLPGPSKASEGINAASVQQQSSTAAPPNPATNSSTCQDKFPPKAQESFWNSLGDKIHGEADAYQMFIMGQMMQRKSVEWLRDTLQETKLAMEKMDKEHKEEMRKRKESEENVTRTFNSFKTLVESFTKKHGENS
ncbi:serine-rich adhesin for platelets-like isoform X2 [Argopecten irradians]